MRALLSSHRSHVQDDSAAAKHLAVNTTGIRGRFVKDQGQMSRVCRKKAHVRGTRHSRSTSYVWLGLADLAEQARLILIVT